jgi:hypothetical protein
MEIHSMYDTIDLEPRIGVLGQVYIIIHTVYCH